MEHHAELQQPLTHPHTPRANPQTPLILLSNLVTSSSTQLLILVPLFSSYSCMHPYSSSNSNQNNYSHSYYRMGAQDSTSTRCALGTSSRVLRMLTESGEVIRYVFLLSAGLRQDILHVGGGGRPVFSSRNS